MRTRREFALAFAIGVGLVGWAEGARADARARAAESVATARGEIPRLSALAPSIEQRTPSAEERLASGDLALRSGNTELAIELLNAVVELHRQGKAGEGVDANAQYLLVEAYFRQDELLSAARWCRALLDRATATYYRDYAGRALARLVDIATRLDDARMLDEAAAREPSLPSDDTTGATDYARAKLALARGDDRAVDGLAARIAPTSEYSLPAEYLAGVALVHLAPTAPPPAAAGASGVGAAPAPVDFSAAIARFERLGGRAPRSPAEQHIVDLAWLAVARLRYENSELTLAREAYTRIARGSPEFSTMLFELAWVHIRLGDYQRAQRALEVLGFTAPETLSGADGALLRADLMLRSGQYPEARELYRSVRDQFDPIRTEVERTLRDSRDPTLYFDLLVLEPDELPADEQVSPLVLGWVREEATEHRVFATIDDIARSRRSLKASRRLIGQLDTLLGSEARIQTFPELEAALIEVLGERNRVVRARWALAVELDTRVASDVPATIAGPRAKRRELMDAMATLPVSAGEFRARASASEREWRALNQELLKLQLQVDQLQATLNGLRRVLEDGSRMGVTSDEESRARFQAEIDATERDIAIYQRMIVDYQAAVALGVAQAGVDDQFFIDDEELIREFCAALAAEVAAVRAGGDAPEASAWAAEMAPVLAEADPVQAQLDAIAAELRASAERSAESIREAVAREAGEVERLAAQLEGVDQEARLLVGASVMESFDRVRRRLASVVLRADTGLVQEAWETREERRLRLRALLRERSREERRLDEELREVLDDSGGEE